MERVSGFEPEIDGFAGRRLDLLAIPAKMFEGANCIRLPDRRMKRATRVARNRDGLRAVSSLFDVRELDLGRDDGTRTRYEQLEGLLARHFAFVPVVHAEGFEPSSTCF